MPVDSPIIVHMKPEALNDIKELGLGWEMNTQGDEIDVIVSDIDYDPEHYLVDPDEQLCHYYEIDYDLVNCIEKM